MFGFTYLLKVPLDIQAGDGGKKIALGCGYYLQVVIGGGELVREKELEVFQDSCIFFCCIHAFQHPSFCLRRTSKACQCCSKCLRVGFEMDKGLFIVLSVKAIHPQGF